MSLRNSQQPEVIRMFDLEAQKRNEFIGQFKNCILAILPKFWNQYHDYLSLLGDSYFTFITLCFYRRRLGEQYTYIGMYKDDHYLYQGVLLNRKYRTLVLLLQLVGRHAYTRIFNKLFQQKGEQIQQNKWKKVMISLLGSSENVNRNIEWLMLMLYMLKWNSNYTIIDTLLQINYTYTVHQNKINPINYKMQGIMLLIVMIIKFIRSIITIKTMNVVKSKPINRISQKDHDNKIDQRQLCRICYDSMINRSSTKCGHIFCWTCLMKVLSSIPECPVCRNSCQPQEVVQLRNY